MHLLLLNAGSSSLKASLVRASDGAVQVQAQADWAGPTARWTFGDRREVVPWRGHTRAFEQLLADLPEGLRGSLHAVGHRIVHGGPFTSSVRITREVRAQIEDLVNLAPLHNPPSLEVLKAAEAHLPTLPQVAVFDTAFHATMDPTAYTYPVPARWTRDWGIRRYGFHGLSHAYCARRASELRGHPASLRLVICHLGHGCSAAAVRDGRCVDTTMGFSPLDGLMMATRSGTIDPSIVLHVEQRQGLTPAQVEAALNRESGLLGVSEVAADMRQVLSAAKEGSAQASLALGIYVHRVRQAIGALAVTLGGVDTLVFTAGVGENSAEVREHICKGLECLGLHLDPRANAAARPDAEVAQADSPGSILVIATREDVTMFREVMQVVGEQGAAAP